MQIHHLQKHAIYSIEYLLKGHNPPGRDRDFAEYWGLAAQLHVPGTCLDFDSMQYYYT